ncbi:Arabinogalactan endo-beta-1,4-galactanase; AltName: Full=Endo-1,4-beta-galactanase; Short=Galactanase [Serendipita indica DSM 11827]|nr:Arabinogalactan endo-beta-1,4-galactanase; AltName: Full=Endo-1,4-beta-galactanase; Short=Galactanase [Serendipita indica DSM 11827]
MRSLSLAVITLSVALSASAQSPAYGQCGGSGYSGPKTCVSGYTCQYSNEWYSQCLPGSGGGGATTTRSSSSSAPSSTQGSASSGGSTSCLSFKGHDISSLALMEKERTPTFLNASGQKSDAVTILASGGANYARLRIWTAGDYSVNYAIALAKRAKNAGMKVLIDLHYSDTWADPAHQTLPSGWPSDLSSLNTKIYTYTKDVVTAFKNAGVNIDMIQIGNEIRQGLLWPTGKTPNWNSLSQLLNSGRSGALAGNTSSPPKIMIHIDNGWDWSLQQWWWDNIQVQGALTLDKVDYIGVSFYPFYDTSATLSRLKTTLTNMANRYGRPIIVAETDWPASCSGVTLSEPSIPASASGQTQWMQKVAQVVCGLPNGLGKGVFYWEPTWLTNSGLGSACQDNTLFAATWNGQVPTASPRSSVNMYKS